MTVVLWYISLYMLCLSATKMRVSYAFELYKTLQNLNGYEVTNRPGAWRADVIVEDGSTLTARPTADHQQTAIIDRLLITNRYRCATY